MAKISGGLHYFDEWKKFVPCSDKFGVSKNCISSRSSGLFRRSLWLCFCGGDWKKLDPKALVAQNSTWQCQAFSLRVIFYEADNMLQRGVQSSFVWQGFLFFCGHRGQPLFLKWHFRLKSLFFSICSEETKMFSCKLDDLWEGSVSRIASYQLFLLYVHLVYQG